MKRNQTLLAALLLALVTSAANGADFYVAPNGNDTHPGTQANPFASLERARTRCAR